MYRRWCLKLSSVLSGYFLIVCVWVLGSTGEGDGLDGLNSAFIIGLLPRVRHISPVSRQCVKLHVIFRGCQSSIGILGGGTRGEGVTIRVLELPN